jgi:hypothetical protein
MEGSAPEGRLRIWRIWSAVDPGARAAVIGFAAAAPLLVWWVGWFPGFLSGDAVDQMGQVASGRFSNQHPAFHTMAMWVVMRAWDHPGMVTLVQVLAMALLLALAARRLAALGVPVWLAGGAAVFVGALPAVGITTIAVSKDVAFTLALLWAFTELLGFAANPARAGRAAPLLRLGGALALVWLFRHNGFITVILFGAALAWVLRHRRRALALVAAPVVGAVMFVTLVLFPLVGVERDSIQPASVFIPDVAASFVHNPGRFSDEETRYLETIAGREVWERLYDCHDSTPLVFAPEFRRGVVLGDAGRFRGIVMRTYLRDPLTVLGHRWCTGSFLFVPPQPAGAYFHRPPFGIAANDLGIERDPISYRVYSATLRVFDWVSPADRLWLTWRPALAVWLAAATFGALAWRRRLGPLALVVALIGAQILNVMLTTPAQEFRFGFGIYLMCLLSVPLAWLTRPGAGVAEPG